MNQMPNRRFTSGLSSGLSILAIFAFGCSLSGYAQTVRSADHPTAATQNAEGKSIEIPGTFKDLPAAKDAVTAKQTAATPNRRTTKSGIVAQLTVDESKGVTVRPLAKSATKRPTRSAVQASSSNNNRNVVEVTDGDFQDFNATAYCLQGRTATGEHVEQGVIAADPRVLPMGTVVHIRAGKYTGTYTVKDTGGRIRGRHVDVYVPSYKEAKAFGRRPVQIRIIGRAGRKAGVAGKKEVLADNQ